MNRDRDKAVIRYKDKRKCNIQMFSIGNDSLLYWLCGIMLYVGNGFNYVSKSKIKNYMRGKFI